MMGGVRVLFALVSVVRKEVAVYELRRGCWWAVDGLMSGCLWADEGLFMGWWGAISASLLLFGLDVDGVIAPTLTEVAIHGVTMDKPFNDISIEEYSTPFLFKI